MTVRTRLVKQTPLTHRLRNLWDFERKRQKRGSTKTRLTFIKKGYEYIETPSLNIGEVFWILFISLKMRDNHRHENSSCLSLHTLSYHLSLSVNNIRSGELVLTCSTVWSKYFIQSSVTIIDYKWFILCNIKWKNFISVIETYTVLGT